MLLTVVLHTVLVTIGLKLTLRPLLQPPLVFLALEIHLLSPCTLPIFRPTPPIKSFVLFSVSAPDSKPFA
jgi:hypothetical protein